MAYSGQQTVPLTSVFAALLDESIEYNDAMVFSGGINPASLPMELLKNGSCVPLYPHNRLRVNTIFKIVRAHGLEPAYTDKYQAYDLVRGPSGQGLWVA
jgi:hypothetical protein